MVKIIVLTEETIRRIVNKFETTGSLVDQITPVRRRNAHSNDNIVAVPENVNERSKSSQFLVRA